MELKATRRLAQSANALLFESQGHVKAISRTLHLTV